MKLINIFVITMLILTGFTVSFLSNLSLIVKADESSIEDIDWWSSFHHDLKNTGYSTSYAPDNNSLLWSYTTGDDVRSFPSVVNGKVYFGGYDDKVYCLSCETGELIWSFTTGENVFSSPAVADGRVYVGSMDGILYCLLEDTGDLVWSFNTGESVGSSPAIYEGKVYFGSYDDNVYCLDANTGELIWNYNTDYDIFSSPAIANEKVYIATLGKGIIYCLDAKKGSHIWNYSTGSSISSSPATAYGKLYVGGNDNKLYCLDADDGSLIWYYLTDDWVASSPAVADGKVFVGSQDNSIYCLDADDGSLIWNYSTDSSVRSSPAIADGKVFVGSYDAKLYCFGLQNNPPLTPSITGSPTGKVGEEYAYTVKTTDPDGDDVEYLFNWDDGIESGWLGPYKSDDPIEVRHSWDSKGEYHVQVKSRDDKGAESDWGTLEVTMPKRKTIIHHPLVRGFFEQYPQLAKFLETIFEMGKSEKI